MRTRALAALGLALFVTGTQWCLVGTLVPAAAAGMHCMPAAAVSADGEAQPAAHGGHCAGMAQNGEGDSAPASPVPPCCVAIAPAPTPEAGRIDFAPVVLLDLPPVAPAPPAAPAATGELLRAPPESPPRLAAPGAPSSPRAPPTI